MQFAFIVASGGNSVAGVTKGKSVELLKNRRFIFTMLALLVTSFGAFAQTNVPGVAEVTTVVTNASTVFASVATLVLAIVGFFVLVSIVRKLRG